MEDQPRPTNCPECGGERVASIMYGLPDFTPELNRELDAGRIALGGGVIFDDSPRWTCLECRHRWSAPGESDGVQAGADGS